MLQFPLASATVLPRFCLLPFATTMPERLTVAPAPAVPLMVSPTTA